MKASKIIIGTLSGLAIGAVIGVLLAPDKGSATRKKIIKKSTDTSDDIKRQFGTVFNTLTDKYNSLVKNGEEMSELGNQELSNLQKINKNQFGTKTTLKN